MMLSAEVLDLIAHNKNQWKWFKDHEDIIDWHTISVHSGLPEHFIREFNHRVDWYYISIHQTLSEDFIREFADRVEWRNIIRWQKLSEEFLVEVQLKGWLDIWM